MNSADRTEADNIRRFLRFEQLWREIDEAARRAEARLRLEHALSYSLRTDALETPGRQLAA
jgi:hypothetical protein